MGIFLMHKRSNQRLVILFLGYIFKIIQNKSQKVKTRDFWWYNSPSEVVGIIF